MSAVDDKLGTWRRVTEQAEPSPELLEAVLLRSQPLSEASTALALRPQPLSEGPTALTVRPSPPRREKPAALTAAERARVFRRGPGARLALWWQELAVGLKALAYTVAGLMVVGTGGWLWWPPESKKSLDPEPAELFVNTPIEASFGKSSIGSLVDYERIDQKVFKFDYKSPVKMVVALHFQARDISANEVVISVNGTDVGFVPPDTLAVNERSNEVLLPPNTLVRNGGNIIAFDNVRNPPGQDAWQVWNIWLEVFPLPELSRDELVRAAQENLQRGHDFWERRTVGAENLYKAWRAYREAWLLLQSLDGPQHELVLTSRNQMREAQVSLDRLCSQLLLEAQSEYNQKQFDAARSTLEHVDEYFPKRDQPCPSRAGQMREYYGL